MRIGSTAWLLLLAMGCDANVRNFTDPVTGGDVDASAPSAIGTGPGSGGNGGSAGGTSTFPSPSGQGGNGLEVPEPGDGVAEPESGVVEPESGPESEPFPNGGAAGASSGGSAGESGGGASASSSGGSSGSGGANGSSGSGGAGGSTSSAGAGGTVALPMTCEDGSVPALVDGCDPGNDANCNGVPNEDCICVDGDERSCAEGGFEGTCAEGVQVCLAQVWGDCSVQPGAADTCEGGNDDNCNGTENDDCDCIEDDTRPCSEGGLFGKCADGEQVCSGGSWGACSITPSANDTCAADNDDNCNGSQNDNCPCTQGETRPCSEGGLVGPCATGTQTCNASGSWGSCSIAPSSYDTCAAGNDANCNGMANSPLNPTCACIEGATQCAPGTPSTQRQTCSASGTWNTATSCPFVCTGNGVCGGACVPEDRDCNGSTPRECNNSGAWVSETACGTSTPCQGEGVCQACPSGSYASNGACVPWTTCNPGQYVQTAGTATANRVCGSCSVGYFSNTTNATSCTQWTDCNAAGGVQSAAGSTTADRVCAPFPSCNGLTNNCGSGGNESCCATLPVAGDSFARFQNYSYYPATISSFKLDKFEVSVGRFRKFKAAWDGGWRPAAASGKHTHVHGGSGLEYLDESVSPPDASYEPGWDTAWASSVDVSNTPRDTETNTTWTSSAGSNETKPINYVNWYEAYAFCIWDQGFLPSEAEWNMAQIGGDDQEDYPWGNTVPGANANLAVYGCYYGGGAGTCTGVANIGNVGAVPAGNGRYGHANLVGNVSEWVFDTKPGTVQDCTDCGNWLAWYATFWGGSFIDALDRLDDQFGQILPFANRAQTIGIRCARTP